MAERPHAPAVDHDARLVEAAEDLEALPGELAALLGADGLPTNVDGYDGLLTLQAACFDVIRLAPAAGALGLRAKARAVLVDDVADGSPMAIELVKAFARDVLRLVRDTSGRSAE